MAARRPRDRNQMLEVAGVGPVKFERYGDAFLDALRAQP
jgi:superfamily II DNA helicase RecQ